MDPLDPPQSEKASDLQSPGSSAFSNGSGTFVGCWSIAWTFNVVSLASFGGGLTAFARQKLVDDRKWLTDDDFLQALAICQILPGPNTINLAVFIGSRLRGLRGAVAAFLGLLTIPIIIVLIAGGLYFDNHTVPQVKAVLNGLAAAAAGMAFGLALKLGVKHVKDPVFMAFAIVTFVTVGLMRFSMIPVTLTMVPFAIWVFSRLDRVRKAGEDIQ